MPQVENRILVNIKNKEGEGKMKEMVKSGRRTIEKNNKKKWKERRKRSDLIGIGGRNKRDLSGNRIIVFSH